MIIKQDSGVTFLETTDLTEEQIEVTQNSYRKFAMAYGLEYERNMDLNGAVIYKTLVPFLRQYEKNKLDKLETIVFAGCGSCRDLQFAENSGFSCMGIDTSNELLDIARKEGVKSPLECVNILKFPYQIDQFGGIYCDTALNHTNRSGLTDGIKYFYNALTKNGVLFLAFRVGNGKVYKTLDNYGERYYLTHSKGEACKLVVNGGFEINKMISDKHPISGRPDFLGIIATKL